MPLFRDLNIHHSLLLPSQEEEHTKFISCSPKCNHRSLSSQLPRIDSEFHGNRMLLRNRAISKLWGREAILITSTPLVPGSSPALETFISNLLVPGSFMNRWDSALIIQLAALSLEDRKLQSEEWREERPRFHISGLLWGPDMHREQLWARL